MLDAWKMEEKIAHYTFLENCAATTPLSQHFALNERYVLMLA